MKKKDLIMLCVFTLLASGCGKGEQTIPTPGGDVKVTKKGDTTTFEVKGQGDKVNVSAAGGDKGVALPDKFPSDVPIMPGAIVKLAITTGEGMSVHLSAPASQADAVKYYVDNLKSKGWQIESTMDMGASSMVAAKKGKRDLAMTVAKEGNGSVVQLMVPREGS